jgi:myo-inositol-1(or 4)-monophosphatase
MTNDLGRELAAAVAAARAAGAITERYFDKGGEVLNTSHKAPGHPVTDADLAANAAIRATLEPFLDSDGWLSEESADSAERLGRDRVWVIDPIDGTKEFIAGIPEYVVSIGLCLRGEPVLGVVFQPTRGDLWFGAAGSGATFNGRAISVSASLPPRPRILVSRTESAKGLWIPHREAFEMTPCGSIAFKICRVAAGDFDGAVTLRPRSEWDIAAAGAILAAAGGRLRTHEGADVRYNSARPVTPSGVIAGNAEFIDYARRAVGGGVILAV